MTGDSIYNLLRLGEVDTDKDDRPLQPPKVLSVEVTASYMSKTTLVYLLLIHTIFPDFIFFPYFSVRFCGIHLMT